MSDLTLNELISTAEDVYGLYDNAHDENAIMIMKDCERNLRRAYIQLRQIQSWAKKEIDTDSLVRNVANGFTRDTKFIRARNGLHEYDVTV